MTQRRINRTAVTLVDLLMSFAIAAILVSVLLPVFQDSREAARNTLCQNRLRQIGIDSQVYHDVYRRLPMYLGAPGAVNYVEHTNENLDVFWKRQQSTSAIALASSVTTEYEIDSIAFDFNSILEKIDFWEIGGWDSIVLTKPSRFKCPSFAKLNDDVPSDGIWASSQPLWLGDPAKDDHFLGAIINTDLSSHGTTDYVACAGASSGGSQRAPSEFWRYRGLITSRERVTFEQVFDGLSNTIMFGENIGKIVPSSDSGPDSSVGSHISAIHVFTRMSWFSGGLVRGRGDTAWMSPGTPATPLLGHALASSNIGFGSFHPQGVNFVKGDGSTQLISRDIDMLTYYALCGGFDSF